MKREFRVDLFLLDHAHDLVDQCAIFQHEQVRVEDAAFGRAHGGADLALHTEDFVPRLDQRAFETADFLRCLGIRQCAASDRVMALAQNENFPPAHTRGNGNAPKDLLSFVQRVGHAAGLT